MKNSLKKRKSPVDALIFLVCLLMACLFLLPLFLMLLATFRPANQLMQMTLSLRIDLGDLTTENFQKLLAYRDGEYFLWYGNSLGLMITQTVTGLLLSSMVGYGLAVYQFRGRKTFLYLVLLLMMVPFEILMIPLYKETLLLGINNTWFGVLLPSVATPFMIFFFRQAAQGLPAGLADAARIDGCGDFRIFFQIMMPLLLPAYGAMGIMQAMGSWNNFLWPLIVLSSSNKMTLPVGISAMVTPTGNTYDVLLAGSTCAIVPVMIIFLFFQKSFISGLTSGGIKE